MLPPPITVVPPRGSLLVMPPLGVGRRVLPLPDLCLLVVAPRVSLMAAVPIAIGVPEGDIGAGRSAILYDASTHRERQNGEDQESKPRHASVPFPRVQRG